MRVTLGFPTGTLSFKIYPFRWMGAHLYVLPNCRYSVTKDVVEGTPLFLENLFQCACLVFDKRKSYSLTVYTVIAISPSDSDGEWNSTIPVSIMAGCGMWRVKECQLTAWVCFFMVLFSYTDQHGDFISIGEIWSRGMPPKVEYQSRLFRRGAA